MFNHVRTCVLVKDDAIKFGQLEIPLRHYRELISHQGTHFTEVIKVNHIWEQDLFAGLKKERPVHCCVYFCSNEAQTVPYITCGALKEGIDSSKPKIQIGLSCFLERTWEDVHKDFNLFLRMSSCFEPIPYCFGKKSHLFDTWTENLLRYDSSLSTEPINHIKGQVWSYILNGIFDKKGIV